MGWLLLHGRIAPMGLYLFGGSPGGWKACGAPVSSADSLKLIGKYKRTSAVDWLQKLLVVQIHVYEVPEVQVGGDHAMWVDHQLIDRVLVHKWSVSRTQK